METYHVMDIVFQLSLIIFRHHSLCAVDFPVLRENKVTIPQSVFSVCVRSTARDTFNLGMCLT